MRRLICALVLTTASLASIARGQSGTESARQDSRRDDILFILKATGNDAKFDSVVQGVIGQFRSKCGGVPEETWAAYAESLKAEMVASIVPLYEKYYSAEDLSALAQFYRSQAYQHVQAVLADINRESRELGQLLAKRKGEEMISELKKRGCFTATPKPEPTK